MNKNKPIVLAVAMKNALTKILGTDCKFDIRNIHINREARGCSGHVQWHGRTVYFTTERSCFGPLSEKFMYRKANSMRDFTGGTNQWCEGSKDVLAREIAKLLTNDHLW